MKYFKYCKKCGKKFNPEEGKPFQTCCDECTKSIKDVNYIKMICHRNGIDLNKIKEFI